MCAKITYFSLRGSAGVAMLRTVFQCLLKKAADVWKKDALGLRGAFPDISWTAIFPRKWRKRQQEPELPDLAWKSQTSFSPGRNYIRPPSTPISGHKAFFSGGGWGCIFWGPTRQEFYTPPLPFIHPPPLGGSFQGWEGGGVQHLAPYSPRHPRPPDSCLLDSRKN